MPNRMTTRVAGMKIHQYEKTFPPGPILFPLKWPSTFVFLDIYSGIICTMEINPFPSPGLLKYSKSG
jgi:hypothetical protein